MLRGRFSKIRGTDETLRRIQQTTLNKYDETCKQLRLTYGSLYGKVALADLLLHVDFTTGLRKIICYTGLYKPNNRKYNQTPPSSNKPSNKPLQEKQGQSQGCQTTPKENQTNSRRPGLTAGKNQMKAGQ
ncbi:MAG: hypothetical protein QW299_07845 [Candidatus Caldarchaeum sp.]